MLIYVVEIVEKYLIHDLKARPYLQCLFQPKLYVCPFKNGNLEEKLPHINEMVNGAVNIALWKHSSILLELCRA